MLTNINSKFTDDYDFIAETINTYHPLVFIGFSEKYKSCIAEQRKNIKDYNSMINSMSILTAALEDAHTNIELPYSEEDLCLNIPCLWFENGLYITDNNYCNKLEKGDRISLIENISVDEYFSRLCGFIPHENKYIAKVRSTKYPYKNYHLFSRLNINNLTGADNNIINITVQRHDKIITVKVPFEKYNGFIKFDDNIEFIKYAFVKNKGILTLNQCIYNEVYRQKLKEFFKAVKEKNIDHIILDLRENLGGNSCVIQGFLSYINIDEFYFYDIWMRDYGNEFTHVISRNDIIKNEKDKYCYSGKITCLVSNATFSSARMFAVVLKDNKIADIIGEKTGGKPTSFGAPSKFTTPNFNIGFRVSARLFKRPDATKDDEEYLEPDIEIKQPIADYLINKDSVLNYIINR